MGGTGPDQRQSGTHKILPRGDKIESPRYLVSLLVVEAAQAKQEVALGRELLREGRPVPQVGHGHMLRRLAVVVLRVLLRAAARVVVVDVIIVEHIDAGEDVVEVAGVPVELLVLHDWGRPIEQRESTTRVCALRRVERCRLGLPTGPDSTHWSNRSSHSGRRAEQTQAH
jgi:hypothetical protein